MTELKLMRGAAGWLRKLGLAITSLLVAVGLAFVAINGASSNANGSISEEDYALSVTGTGVAGTFIANGGTNNFPAVSSTATWEAWINPTDTVCSLMCTWMSKEAKFSFGIQNNQFAFTLFDTEYRGWFYTGVRPTLNAWQHVVFVKNGASVTLFLNGQDVYSQTAQIPATLADNNNPFTVGDRANTERFRGQVDEVRVWNVVRSTSQIATSMHQRLVGNESGLLGYWDFNEPSGTTVHNRVSGGINLSLTTNAWSRVDVKQVSLTPGGDTVITFPRTYLPGVGGWRLPSNVANIRTLVVAGGGSGGSYVGSGGGGGGVTSSALSLAQSATYSVVVGQGGTAVGSLTEAILVIGKNGQNSSAFGLTAIGGGAGGSHPGVSGTSGGSGGGGGSYNPGISSNGSLGTAGQGFAGGDSIGGRAGAFTAGAGGGGAGAKGGNTSDAIGRAGDGGSGTSSSILGTTYFFGGGGGGGSYQGGPSATPGNGGAGGGGGGTSDVAGRAAGLGGGSALNSGEPGGTSGNYSRAGSGGANTGGGGGGPGHVGVSGAGGSGVVILRYTPTKDLVWDKNETAQSFAYTNSQVIPASGSWTYEAWYYLDSNDVSAGYRGLFSQMDTGQAYSQRVSLWLNAGKIHVTTPTQNLDVANYTFLANRWYHIAYARNVNDVEFFINGVKVLDQTVANWGTIGPEFAIGGARQWDLAYPEVSGAIDQVKVWSTALDETGVRASMNTYSSSGVTGTLKAHYDFNEFESGIVRDRTGNNNNLVFNTDVAGGYLSTNFNENFVIETGTAHSAQTYVKFNRSYLTATGGWTAPSGVSRYKALIVGGGGAGGDSAQSWTGGSGGAGGVFATNDLSMSGVVAIQVGQGGPGSVDVGPANAGGDSAIGALLVGGGGGGRGELQSDSQRPDGRGGSNYLVGGNGGGAERADFTNFGRGGTHSASGILFQGRVYVGRSGVDGGSANDNASGGFGGQVPLAERTSALSGTSVQYAKRGEYIAWTGTNQTPGSGGSANYTYGQTNLSRGEDGAAGLVLLSYGATLDITRSPIVSRVGSPFSQSIRVQQTNVDGTVNNGAFQVSLTASPGLTINGVPLTQSYTVTTVNGVADFTGLGFSSSVTGPLTLAFATDAFVGTSLVVTPTFFAAGVNITDSGTTTGHFLSGEFFASQSNTVATINRSDLLAHMASFSTTISSSGRIWVQSTVSSTATFSLTLRTSTSISASDGITIRTNNGDIVFWSDSNGDGEGNIFIGQNTVLDSSGGRTGNGLSGGGRITLAGSFGNTAQDADGHPLGAAANTSGHGIYLETNSKLRSGGGDISIRANNSGDVAIRQNRGVEINSGLGQIKVFGISRNGANGYITDGGTWISNASESPAIELLAQTSGTGNEALEQYNNSTSRFDMNALGTADVGISISAMLSSTSTNQSVYIPHEFDLLSSTGDIQFTSNGRIMLREADARNIGAKASSLVTGSSADITFSSAGLDDDSNNTLARISSSGSVSFIPFGSQFTADFLSNFAMQAGNVLFGNFDSQTGATREVRSNRTITSSGNVRIAGNTVVLAYSEPITSTSESGRIEIRSPGQTTLNTSLRANGAVNLSVGSTSFTGAVITGSATVVLESFGTAFGSNQSTAGLSFGPQISGLIVGKLTETRDITLASPASINGPISVFGGSIAVSQPQVVTSQSATLLLSASSQVSSAGSGSLRSSGDIRIVAGGASLGAALSAPSTGGQIAITSDTISATADIAATASGRILIAPRTSGRPIVLGATSTSALAIVSTINPFLKATTLQIGSQTSGGITVAGNTTFASADVGSLRLITPGSVSTTNNSILTAQNLAITAGGGVNLPGSNSVSGAVAISASSMVTYSSAVSYSATTVDGVTPIFGVGTAISQTNSPSVEQANEFLSVAFNPPPQIVITDFYGKVLDGNNRLAYQYSVSASAASGSGTVTGLTTTSRVGGLVTFTNLQVTSAFGVYAFTFSASLSPSVLTVRSVNYNILPPVPEPPTNVSAAVTGTSSANVTFLAPTNNGGSEILSYTATSTPGSISATINQSGSGTITVTGLTSNTSYSFTVTARNAGGTSSPSVASLQVRTDKVVQTVTLDPNGGSGATVSMTIPEATPTSLLANTSTRAGFVFRGWNTLANGTGINYANQESVSVSANLGLFAQWSSILDRALVVGAERLATGSDVIQTGTSTNFTFEAWVYPTNLTGWRGIFNQSNGLGSDANRTFLGTLGGEIQFALNSGTMVDTNHTISVNAWSHIALSVTGSQVRVFVNGLPVSENLSYGRTAIIGSAFHLGGTHVPTEFWQGSLDQVKVWSTALDQASIGASMHTYSTSGVTGTLAAHYDFNAFNSAGEFNKASTNSNLSIAAGVTSANYSESPIVQTGTAHTNQTFVRFNRTYLTATGGWTPPSGVSRYKALAVGGGGSGGTRHGGGGGAGALLWTESFTASAVLPIRIGLGGMGHETISATAGRNGQSSFLGNLEVKGGGGGNGGSGAATSGGSGGGAASSNNLQGAAGSGLGLSNAGGNGDTNNIHWLGGGGGGAMSAGGVASAANSLAGAGGAGFVTNITGVNSCFAAGGGGGRTWASGSSGGVGGTCTSGQVSATVATTGGAGSPNDSTAGSGQANSGSGGGGGGLIQAGELWGKSGSGGSGVVILSYGATLDITRSPVVARVGSPFSQSIQLQQTNLDGSINTGNFQVAVTASAGLTINGVALTRSYTVTSTNGIADFTGLGFAANVTGPLTLSFTSDSFVGTTMTITPSFVSNNLVINNSNGTTGVMFGGEFFASSSAGISYLNTADLHAHAVANSISISVSGSISVSSDVNISISNRALTLRARGDIQVGNVNLLTQGELNFFSDSDGNGSGSIVTGASSIINSRGGRIMISGGTDPSTGYAAGSQISQWSGVRLLGQINSEGGDIVIRGRSGGSVTPSDVVSPGWTAGVLVGQTTIDSATGRISISAQVNSSSDTSLHHWGVSLGLGSTAGRFVSSTGDISIRVDPVSNALDRRHGLAFWPGEIVSTEGNINVSVTASSGVNSLEWNSSGSSRVETRGTVLLESRSGSTATLRNITLSSSNQVTIRANRLSFATGAVVTSSALLTLEPFGTVFSAGLSTANLSLGPNIQGFTVGKTSETGTITLSSAITISGPITVNAGNIDVDANLTVTSLSAEVLFKARSSITVMANDAIRSNGGDLVFWADSDSTSGGVISLLDKSTVCSALDCSTSTSGGGDILLAGGLADPGNAERPGGFATGMSTATNASSGVFIGTYKTANTGARLYSAGGNITVRGKMAPLATDASSEANGISAMSGAVIDAGVGKILLIGESNTGGSSNQSFEQGEIRLNVGNTGTTLIRSISTADDSVVIEARRPGNTLAPGHGVYTMNSGTTVDTLGGMSLRANILSTRLGIALSVSGPVVIEPQSGSLNGGTGSASAFELDFANSGSGESFLLTRQPSSLRVGALGNTGTIAVNSSFWLTGNLELISSQVNIAANISNRGENKLIRLTHNTVAISAEVAATNSSRIEISPMATGRGLVIGGASSSALALSTTSASLLKATTLQLGSPSTSRITLASSTSFSVANVSSLRLITSGEVTASPGAILSAANLAIDAGGGVNLPGSNSVLGAVAISASSMVTYSSAVSYSPGVVDGVTPVFGVGKAISLTNSPTTEEANEFLAVTFNPPPQVQITDHYNKVLDGNNRTAYTYTVSASVASGSGVVQGLTSSSRVGGLVTFNALRVTSGIGVYAFTFSAELSPSSTLTLRSVDYNVMAGEPGQLQVIASTTSAQSGKTGLNFTVIVRDAFGNAITAGDHKNISVSASISGTTATLVSGGEVRANDSGIATFSNLIVSGSVSDTITLSFRVTYTPLGGGSTTLTSSGTAITITPGDAVRVLLSTPAAGAASQVAFTTQPQVSVVDAYGNIVRGAAYSISASVSPGVTISPATATVNTVSGVAVFSGTSISGLVGSVSISYRVTSAGGNLLQVAEQSIALTFGAPARLSVSPTAINATNRTTLDQLVVRVLDASGNVISSGTQRIEASLASATLTGTQEIFASSGVATFNALTISGQVGSHNLVFSASGIVSASVTLTLNHGAAASIDLTVSATAKNAQTLATQPVVRILDADGNLVTTGAQSTQTVELIVSPGTLTGTTQISASAGVATFSGISLFGTAGSHTLTGRIYLPSQLSDNETITLGFGNATKLTLETSGAGAASGIALTTQPVLTLRDSSNNIVTGVAHNVVATITPSASTSGTTVAVNTSTGTATFTALSISGTVGSYTISFSVEGASSSDVASVSQDIQLTHGVATSVRVVSQPTSGNAGVTLSPLVVEVIDARGNRITTGSTASKTVTITNAKPFTTVFGTKAVSLSVGVATFDNISLDVADNQYFRYEVAGIPGANTAMFLVSGGAPAKLGFTCGPVVDRTAGSSQANDLCVRVYDRFGNFATLTSDISVSVEAVLSSDTSSVSKTISSTTVSPGVGFATIAKSSLALTKVGVFRFKVNASNLESGLSGPVTITNSTVNKLVIVQDVPSTVQSGLTFSPAVRLQVQDAYGNPVVTATYSASVSRVAGTISSIVGGVASSPSGSSFIDFPDLALNATNGTTRIRFTANFGSPFTIDSSTFTVASGAAFRLSVSPTVQTVANRVALSDVVVRVLDSSGNLVSGSTAQVSADMAGASLSGIAILYSANGIASFSGLVISGQVGTYDLSLTSTGLVGATVSVTVTHGAANRVELIVPSATKNARTSSAITATIFDADGNRVSTSAQASQTVTLTANGATLSGVTRISASAGIATFSNVALTGGIGTKSISATILLPTPITQSQDIELNFGDAFRLDLTTNAAGFVNRVAFDTAPVITVRDVSDNVVPTSGMDIRVTVTSASVSGSITASAATGVASFASNLTLRGLVGTHTLTFTAEGTSSSGVATTTQVVSLTHGVASRLVLVRSSANALSGAQFTTQPTFKVVDPEGNLVTTGAGAVSSIEATVSGNGFANGTGDANLTGTVAISASAGLATYSNLVLTGRVASYTVSYQIPGTSMSTSETVALAAGAATDFRFIQVPTNVVAGETFSPAVSAEIIDAQGNRVLTAGNGVSVNVVWAVNGSGAYATNTGFVPTQGLLNLSNSSISSAATYALRLEMAGQSALSGVASTASPTFVVSPAAVSQIEITSGTNPVFGLNNQTFGTQPSFIFKDRFGNQATNAGNITVSASVVSANSGDVIRVISPTVRSGGGAGASFTGLGLEGKVGNYVISFSAELNGNIFASVASAPIEVRHGVATQIAITRNSADVLAGIDFATQPRIELRDSAGNRVSTSAQATSDLTVSYAGSDWTSTKQGVDLSGTQAISFSAGIATFTDLRLSGKVGSYTLKYTSAINSNISVSEAVVVEPGNASKISQLQGPQDVIAGEQFPNALRVQILDAYDNRVTRLTSSTTVVAKLISSASNVLETSAEYGAQGGVVTFSGLVFTTSGEVTVRYEVGANSSVSPLTSTTSATFKITHAAPDSIQWLFLPVSTIQNDFVITGVGASRPQLIAKDRFGNVVDTGTVKISVSSIVGTPQSLTGGQVDGVSGSATIQSLKLRATVGSYTLRFAASTLANSAVFSSISHVVEVTPGVADQLSVKAGHPTTARSNMALSPQPEISILDSAQNLVSFSSGVINISVQGAQHAGQTSLAASSGVAAFGNVKLAGSASSVVTLSYALQGTDISTSKMLTLAAGAAVSFDLDWTAANIQTRAAINPAPKLILRDVDGNVVLSDATTQGVAKLMRYGSVVTESVLVTAASGEINFAGLTYIATPGGGYSLKFEAGLLPAVTTSDFVVLPGPVSQLEIQIQPSTSASVTALTRTGESLATQPKIRLLDVDGNLVTTVTSGTVTAAIASGVGGQLLTASATIVNGVATFTELGLIGRVETPTISAEVYTLQFGYGGFSTSPSIGISMMHNVATQISLLTEAAGGRSGLTFTTKPQVVLLDRFGNRVFKDAADNLVASPNLQSGTGAPGVVNNDQGTRDNAGVYTFDMGISGLVGNTYGIDFLKIGGGLTPAAQTGVTISHGNANKIGFLTLPSSTDSNQVRTKTGQNLLVQPVIEIQDAVGNRVLNATFTVTSTLEQSFRGSRDFLRGHTVSAVAGVATFTNLRMIVDPAQLYRLNFTFGLNVHTAPVQLQVTHADAEYLTIATSPDGGNKTGASLSRSPIITVHDFDGNLTTSLNGASVSALIASGGGSVVVDGSEKAVVQGGIAQFSNLKIVALPGVDQTLYFNLDGFNNSASATVTSTWSNAIQVTFSDPHKLSVFQQPCTGANCGIGETAGLLSTQPVVEVQDFYGNRVTDFVGTITVTAQGTDGHLRDANARIASVDAVVASGLATFSTLRLEGRPNTDYRLNFAVGSLVSTTSNVVQVKNTAASYLAITAQPVGGVTGAVLATQPVIEVRDRFDNVVVDYSGSVQASVVSGPNRVGGSAPVVSGSSTVTVANGVATFASLRLIGLVNRDYVLGFSDGTRNVSSSNVRLSAGSAATVELVNVPAAFRTGDLLTTQPVLRVLDFDGNLAVSTSVTITAGVASGGGYIESGTVSSAVTGGYVTFSSLVLVGPVGVNQQLSFTATTADGTFSVNTTTALSVRHTDIAYFDVQTPYVSGNYQQGAVLPVQPKLFGFDRYGNKAIFDNSTVVTAGIGSGSGGAVSGSATAAVTAGEVQFAGLAVTGSPGVSYKLNFSANLVTGAYSVLNPDAHTVFKTAAIQLSYPLTVFSLSATVSPTVALTDSTENAPVYTTTTAQFCSVNSSTGVITMLGAGSCVIRSSVANGTYYRSNTLDVTLPIAKADQAPLVLQSANNVNFGSVLTLAATGGSSTAPIEFASTGRCVILGDKLMPIGNATEGAPACTLLVLREGDANFNEATVLRIPITVNRIAQAPLTIGNSRNATVGEVDLFTVGGSGTGTVSYTVQSQTGTQCSVVGNVLTSTGNGVCEISASKAQDQNYNLASSPAASFTFSKQVQQISFTSMPPSMPLPGQVYQASATASSALTISFTITMGGGSAQTSQSAAVPAVCSISGSEVQFLRSGNCEITATQAGNSVFAAASTALRINIGTLNQFITFPMIEDSVFGSPALRLNADASSGLPVSYTISAGITACTVTNGLVNFLAAGDCEIIATQTGNSSYAAAPPKSRAFRITPDRASAPSLVSSAVGNQWFTLRYTQPSYTGGSNIIGYRLEVLDQSTNSAGVYVNTACTTLTCTMAGIPNDKPYVARIAAITAAGVGQFSQYSRTMTPTAAQMGVTELAADVSSAGLDLNWVRPAAIEGTFSRYEVFVWVTGTTPPATASAVVTNSSSSTVSLPISSISSGVQIAPAISNRVAIIRPAMNITSRLFVFGAQATRPMGFVTLASVQSQTTASATVGYSMKVVTITDTFSSSMTINTANGLKIGLETPAAPTQLGLDTSDPTKILVTWAAPLSDGGFAIDDYKVVVNGQTICANIQTRVCEISPLNVSTTYNVQVFARNALGFGEAAVASHTTPTPPPPVVIDTRTTEALVRIPQLVSFTPKFARAGELVEVSGRKINSITDLKLGDVDVSFTAVNDSTLRFRVPADTKPGTYDIQHFSEFGKVSVIDALIVIAASSTVSPEPETQSPVTPITQSPVTESPTDPTDPVDPTDPGESGGSGSGGNGSGGSGSSGGSSGGSDGSGSGNGSEGNGSGNGDSGEGESEPGTDTESSNAGLDEPTLPTQQNPQWWILLIALLLAGFSYWALRRERE